MSNLKSLAKDTAIYGLSSIVARFVGYLLVPIETAKFSASGGQFGIITNLYAYVALLLVVLTYGMETTFFRFMNRPGEQPDKVYATALRTVSATSVLFIGLIALFLRPVSNAIGYQDHPEFIMIMAACVAVDAFINIPMAYLRYAHRPIKFVSLRMISIVVNIVGVLLSAAFPPQSLWYLRRKLQLERRLGVLDRTRWQPDYALLFRQRASRFPQSFRQSYL